MSKQKNKIFNKIVTSILELDYLELQLQINNEKMTYWIIFNDIYSIYMDIRYDDLYTCASIIKKPDIAESVSGLFNDVMKHLELLLNKNYGIIWRK